MLFRRIRTSQQKFFLVLVGIFVFSLVGLIFYRSSQTINLLALGRVLKSTEDPFSALSLGGEEIKLHLKDFHRIQIEKGDVTWDMKATEARYLPGNNIAYVNDPELVINRKDKKPFNLKAKAGKLHLVGEKMQKAELEGDIRFYVDGDLLTRTDYAVLEVDKNLVSSPNIVRIEGEGFEVSGKGLNINIDKRQLNFKSGVHSVFYGNDLEKSEETKK